MTNPTGVTARTVETGEPVDVQHSDHGAVLQSDGGAVVVVGSDAPIENVKNPLGEQEIRVRVRPGVSFQFQGDFVKDGDEFNMPISMARAASMYVDQITSDGTLKPVPHENQRLGGTASSQDMAGMARHERIGVLEQDLKLAEARVETLRQQLEREKSAQTQEIEQRRQADERRRAMAGGGAAPGSTSPNPAYTPGTPGGHGNVGVPPRPGEPSINTTEGQAMATPKPQPGPVAGTPDVKGPIKQ